MQRSSEINGYPLRATDGAIGTIEDLLFDEGHLGLRWVVIDTGNWLPSRKVLLPPSALIAREVAMHEYAVDLTPDQVKTAPGLETDKPVSRQFEVDIFSYYSWDPYWSAQFGYRVLGGLPPAGISTAMRPARFGETERSREMPEGDPRLHSTGEVSGYNVEATDGSIGRVDDFMIEEDEWVIRYLMIDTRNWWPGKKVLISPDWMRDIAWNDQRVFLDVTRDKVKGSPEFEPSMAVDRDYEERIYGY